MSEIEAMKLLYARDFLLRYSSVQKPDPAIAEKLLPVLNTPTLGTSCTIPKRTKHPPLMDRKNTSNPVYFQKENTLNLSHPIISKPVGLDSFTTPVKGALVARPVRPFYSKTPNTRKTWVAAVESNGPLISSESLPSQEVLQQMVPDSALTPYQPAFNTPVSSPNLKTPISKSLHESSTPSSSSTTQTEAAQFLSPKSLNATPYKTSFSPLGRFASSKSPRSPIRPISPLDEQRLAQRQKQIDYGYRTVGYLRYRLLVAKDHRKPDHPRTPKKKVKGVVSVVGMVN